MSDPENQAEPVREAVRAYAALQPQLASATQAYVALIQVLLDDAGIDYLSVTGRTKSVASFAAKANRTEGDGPLYPDPLEQITDQIGVRVITYVHSDVAAVAEVLDDELAMLDDRDLGEETARSGRFGYASRHLLVQTHPGAELPTLEGHRASVQVRTVLQHAWAEFEHDIRYKGNVPEDAAADLDRRFTLAAGLIELADREFATIRERIQMAAPGSAVEADADHIVGQELATFLAGHYSDAGWSHTDHYDWIAGLLTQLGIDSDRRPRRPAHLGRRRRGDPADGLPLPRRCRTTPRRRAARDLRRAVRHPRGQQPPGPAAARPAGEAQHARGLTGRRRSAAGGAPRVVPCPGCRGPPSLPCWPPWHWPSPGPCTRTARPCSASSRSCWSAPCSPPCTTRRSSPTGSASPTGRWCWRSR